MKGRKAEREGLGSEGKERRNKLSSCRQVRSNFNTALSHVFISVLCNSPELGWYRRNIMNRG